MIKIQRDLPLSTVYLKYVNLDKEVDEFLTYKMYNLFAGGWGCGRRACQCVDYGEDNQDTEVFI